MVLRDASQFGIDAVSRDEPRTMGLGRPPPTEMIVVPPTEASASVDVVLEAARKERNSIRSYADHAIDWVRYEGRAWLLDAVDTMTDLGRRLGAQGGERLAQGSKYLKTQTGPMLRRALVRLSEVASDLAIRFREARDGDPGLESRAGLAELHPLPRRETVPGRPDSVADEPPDQFEVKTQLIRVRTERH